MAARVGGPWAALLAAGTAMSAAADLVNIGAHRQADALRFRHRDHASPLVALLPASLPAALNLASAAPPAVAREVALTPALAPAAAAHELVQTAATQATAGTLTTYDVGCLHSSVLMSEEQCRGYAAFDVNLTFGGSGTDDLSPAGCYQWQGVVFYNQYKTRAVAANQVGKTAVCVDVQPVGAAGMSAAETSESGGDDASGEDARSRKAADVKVQRPTPSAAVPAARDSGPGSYCDPYCREPSRFERDKGCDSYCNDCRLTQQDDEEPTLPVLYCSMSTSEVDFDSKCIRFCHAEGDAAGATCEDYCADPEAFEESQACQEFCDDACRNCAEKACPEFCGEASSRSSTKPDASAGLTQAMRSELMTAKDELGEVEGSLDDLAQDLARKADDISSAPVVKGEGGGSNLERGDSAPEAVPDEEASGSVSSFERLAAQLKRLRHEIFVQSDQSGRSAMMRRERTKGSGDRSSDDMVQGAWASRRRCCCEHRRRREGGGAARTYGEPHECADEDDGVKWDVRCASLTDDWDCP